MPLISLLKWWYGLGWRDQTLLVRDRFQKMSDFFSIGLSLRSLFSPFKQIDADSSRKGSLGIVLRAMLDQLFSRVFGAVIRSFLILLGCIELLLEAVVGLIRLTVWPLVPLAPVLLLVVSLSGWTP